MFTWPKLSGGCRGTGTSYLSWLHMNQDSQEGKVMGIQKNCKANFKKSYKEKYKAMA